MRCLIYFYNLGERWVKAFVGIFSFIAKPKINRRSIDFEMVWMTVIVSSAVRVFIFVRILSVGIGWIIPLVVFLFVTWFFTVDFDKGVKGTAHLASSLILILLGLGLQSSSEGAKFWLGFGMSIAVLFVSGFLGFASCYD
jgi:hypothetical protein